METASVEVGTYQTNKDGDVNRSGRATAIDYAWIKQYIINGVTIGVDQPWAGDVNDSGALDVGDLNDERWRILHPFAP